MSKKELEEINKIGVGHKYDDSAKDWKILAKGTKTIANQMKNI